MEQPWWVAPLFGGAGFGFGIGRIIIARFKTHAPTFEQAMAATALFLMAYIASSVLGDSFALLVISGLAIATLLRYDSSKLGYLHAGLSAVAGSIVEIVLIDAGLFHYTDSEGALFVLGIPLWLPMLYVCGATSAGCFARYFSQP